MDAYLDTREAWWYGPWNMFLCDFHFNSFCVEPFATITYLNICCQNMLIPTMEMILTTMTTMLTVMLMMHRGPQLDF